MITTLVQRSAPESSGYDTRTRRREHGIMASYVISKNKLIYITLYNIRYATMHQTAFGGGSTCRSWFVTPQRVTHLSRFKTRMTKP